MTSDLGPMALREGCLLPKSSDPGNPLGMDAQDKLGAENDFAERQDAQWLFSREVQLTCQQIGGKMSQDEIWAGAAGMPRLSSLSHFLWPRGNALYHGLPHTARPPPVHGVRLQH